MQIKGKYSWAKHLDFMLIDMIALLLSFVLVYYFKFNSLIMNVEWKRLLLILILLNLVITFFANPYSGILHRRYYQELGKAFFIVASNVVCAVIIFYVFKVGANYSREVVLYTYVVYYCMTVALKYIWKKLLISGRVRINTAKKRNLFLVCSEENAERDIHSIYSTDLPLYDIKGIYILPNSSRNSSPILYHSFKGDVEVPVVAENFEEFVIRNNIDEVLVCVPPEEIDANVYKRLIDNGIGVGMLVESIIGLKTEEQFVSNIGVNKVLSIGTFSFTPSQQSYLLIKRLFDILCGIIGFIVLIPITVFVKLAYLLSGDKAKIFYRQKRVGLNGKIIKIWKFRSMVPNAQELLKDLLKNEKYRKEWEENQKLENDPRITRVGAFLRKTSIDELPQFLNVLIGDMSLVGPRPLVEGELQFHNGLKLYERVKPGITGWWGCNGRSNIDYHERLELEYYYVKNCSLYLDIICIFRTVYAVLKGEGAQ